MLLADYVYMVGDWPTRTAHTRDEVSMIKREELSNPNSCLNRAKDDEVVFVLRAHDITAPSVIRYWCIERIATGKNKRDDEQIMSALADAERMERQRKGEDCVRPGCGHVRLIHDPQCDQCGCEGFMEAR